MKPQETLARGLEALGVALGDELRQRLLRYIDLLAKWNKTYNLTAIRNPEDMVKRHVLDSLAILEHLPMPTGEAALADAGSGAGLPGIPLAVCRPEWRVALADASEKKCAFLRQAKIELDLGNVEVHEGRVEAWRPRRRFHVVVSRAFAELAQFVAVCRHLLVSRGVLAAMKGAVDRTELADMPAGWDCSVRRLRVPFLDAERHLVLCRAIT